MQSTTSIHPALSLTTAELEHTYQCSDATLDELTGCIAHIRGEYKDTMIGKEEMKLRAQVYDASEN